MTTVEKISLTISAISVLGALLFAYLAFRRNQKSDDKGKAQQIATISSDLGYIKGGIDDVKRELREQRENIAKLSERITRAEENANKALEWVKRLENQINQMQGG